MSYRLEFRAEASADIAEAFSWYEVERAGLGAEFEAELDRTLHLVITMPGAGRVVYRTLRRALMRRFPFVIYYRFEGDLVEVRGVLHTRRRPGTWRRRA